MTTQNSDKFNLQVVHDKFQQALQEKDDDVNMQLYLDSYKELDKFFLLMGSVFGFVSSDLVAKVDILQDLLKNAATAEQFVTVKKMMKYEKENQLLDKPGYVSGSRTLLRLHRGLGFIKLFLLKIYQLKDEESTSYSCREAYDETLAEHHSFWVKNGAKIAMYTMPTREHLLQRVCGNSESIQKALEILPETLDITGLVYDRIDILYTKDDLHSLP